VGTASEAPKRPVQHGLFTNVPALLMQGQHHVAPGQSAPGYRVRHHHHRRPPLRGGDGAVCSMGPL